MKFRIEQWSIDELLALYENGNLNLNPPYQRNDIWPLANKKRLVDSIKNGYPLPMFFLHQKEETKFDIVDGQQRTRTLIGYKKDIFPDMNKEKYSVSNQSVFNDFIIGVTVIYDEQNDKILQDFYYRVNKFGTKLNRPEILRAQYFDTHFQNLVEEIASSVEFQRLQLFTETSLDRMNDMDFIGELLALTKNGISDKKIAVDKLYEDKTFDEEAVESMKNEFLEILFKVLDLNTVYNIIDTRYSQKNDFYTLWSFLLKHADLDKTHLEYLYKLLILISPDISPTNEDCFALQEYATNCVSQSNSKRAREDRLQFFEDFLLNKDPNPLEEKDDKNKTMDDILKYYKLDNSSLINLYSDFYVISFDKLNLVSKIKL
ncbi:MAG: DUF262 domain-containing protein [Ignavibacteriales bacterium]|nr:DUF262 domain-containing protein [Ignavibacteriales bacterium]